MAYSSLLNANEQLFFVQFHLQVVTQPVAATSNDPWCGPKFWSYAHQWNSIQLCHLHSVSNEEFLTRSRSRGYS